MAHGEDDEATCEAAASKVAIAVDDGAGGQTPTLTTIPRSRRQGGRAQRRASAPTIDPGSNHYVEPDASERAVSINDFELIHMLGSGGVGNVWYGVERRSRHPYAVKIIEKHQILGQTSLARVLAEREIMTMLKHPFIVNLHYAMQDDTRIFFVLDYMSGGDFFKMMKQIPNRKMEEPDARFYACEILLALEYLHNNGITFRDLKPENVLVSDQGHICVADFGLAVARTAENSSEQEALRAQKTVCGTPEYMAPEVIREDGHGKLVDYWALGVMVYEMLCGKTPWAGLSATDMFFSVLTQAVPFPDSMSKEVRSLISSLMAKDPNSRLGRNGPEEVKKHPWFASTDWVAMYNQRIRPPFVPEKHFSKHKVERTKSKVAMETFKTTFKPYSSPQRQSERHSGSSEQIRDPDEGGSAAASPTSGSGASTPLAGSGVAAARVLKATPQAPQCAPAAAAAADGSGTVVDLAKSFAQHQHTFKSTQGLALVHAATGVIAQADASFTSMMGQSTTDSDILQHISEDDRQRAKEALANAAAAEQRLRVHMPTLGSTVDVQLLKSTDCDASVLWWQTVVPPS